MKRIFPIATWLPQYRKAYWHYDATAGITVAVLLVPQAMAYALLAGLPPITGLYAALAGLVVYAILGTSKQLSIGPAALDSLLVASGLGAIATAGSSEYIALAITLAFMAGALQFLFGTLRMGFLVNFLSNPVISGFTSAAAKNIGLSQLKHLLNVPIPSSQQVHKTLENLIFDTALSQIDVLTLIMGIGCFSALILLRRWNKSFPGALLVMIASAFLVWKFNLVNTGMVVVGDLPEGLPQLALPKLELDMLSELFYLSIAVALVGFLETIAITKKTAAQQSYKVDANQELISLGVANMSASTAGGFPIAGSFSRTAVNADAGAKTQLSSVITAAIIACTLLLFTSLFHFVPVAALSAIIIVAVSKLVDITEAKRLYTLKRKDFLLLLVSFVATLLLGIQQGLLISVLASFLMILSRISRPPTVIFGRIPGTDIYRNVLREPKAREVEGLVIFRIDASLYFANASYLKDQMYKAIDQHSSKVNHFIFDTSSINEIDSSAEAALREIIDELKSSQVELYFTNVKGRVMDMFKNSGLYEYIGKDHFFYSKGAAVNQLANHTKAAASDLVFKHGTI